MFDHERIWNLWLAIWMKCAFDECNSEYYARILWRYYSDFIMLKTECNFRPDRHIWDQADVGFHHSFLFDKMNSRWIQGRILTLVCTEILIRIPQFTSVQCSLWLNHISLYIGPTLYFQIMCNLKLQHKTLRMDFKHLHNCIFKRLNVVFSSQIMHYQIILTDSFNLMHYNETLKMVSCILDQLFLIQSCSMGFGWI